MRIQWSVWECELLQMRAEGCVDQTLGIWLVAGGSEGQTKVGGGRGVAVVA